MQNSYDRSKNDRNRRISGITVKVIGIVLIAIIAINVYQGYQRKLEAGPILIIEDSYGRQTKIYQTNPAGSDTIKISGPAKIWSPRYGIAVQKMDWRNAKLQVQGIAMELKTPGAVYNIDLQPSGWNTVDHDLANSLGSLQVYLSD